jgi:lysophospholipase L1-like esterase
MIPPMLSCGLSVASARGAGGGGEFSIANSTIARVGDSVTAEIGTVSSLRYDAGYAAFSRIYGGSRFDHFPAVTGAAAGNWVHGKSGYRVDDPSAADDIFRGLAPNCITDGGQYVMIAGGTNDLGNDRTPAQVSDGLIKVANLFRSSGRKVIGIHTILHVGEEAADALTKGPKIAESNDLIKTKAAAAGYRVFDAAAAFPAGATAGTSPVAYYRDNLHPSLLGAMTLGKAEAAWLAEYLPAATHYETGSWLSADPDFSAPNYLTAWNTNVASGAEFTDISKVERAGGLGNWLKVVYANGDATGFSSLLLRSTMTPTMAEGDIIEGVAEVWSDDWSSQGVHLLQDFWSGGSTASRDIQLASMEGAVIPLPFADQPMVFRSPRRAVPAGRSNGYVRIYFSGSGTYYIGRAGILKYS